MRDPLSRKLFTTRDAREHLRGMGGIMSSSPRLAETVAKFNDGGGVIAPVIPTVPPVSGIPETADILAQAEAMFGPARLQWPDDAISQAMQVLMAQGSTGAPAPTAPTGLSSDVLAELDVLGVSPEEFSRLSAEEQQNILTFEDPTALMRERGAEVFEPYQDTGASGAATFVAETLFPERAAEMRRRDAAAEREPPAVAEQRQAMAESRAAAAARTETEAETGDAEARAVDQTAAEQEATEQAAAAEQERQEAARRAQEELERSRGTGDAGGDLDTTFDQMLGRLERVMGTKDEDSRQKAMANLAMIGLAIAAGQSPDALTNIAQGALTGMQAIRREQASEEAAQREMRLTALQMASAEVDNRRKLQNALEIAGLRSGGRDPYTRERMRQQLVVAITNRINEFPQVQNPDGSINAESLNATVESLLEAGVLPEDLSESDRGLLGVGD
jgi:hypothetical protein